MKLALILIFIPFISFAQKDSAIRYSEVVTVDAPKDQLYQRARSWFNDAFKSSKDVLQIQDKETGEIAGNGPISGTVTYKMMGTRSFPADYRFALKIFVKDGKYKYELSDIENYMIANSTDGSLGIITTSNICPIKYPHAKQGYMNDLWNSGKQDILPKVENMLTSLKNAMNKPATNDF